MAPSLPSEKLVRHACRFLAPPSLHGDSGAAIESVSAERVRKQTVGSRIEYCLLEVMFFAVQAFLLFHWSTKHDTCRIYLSNTLPMNRFRPQRSSPFSGKI